MKIIVGLVCIAIFAVIALFVLAAVAVTASGSYQTD